MIFRQKTVAVFLLVLGFMIQPLYAKALKDFEINYKFPGQGVSSNTGGLVDMHIPYLPDFQSGKITYSVKALPYVIESSDANDLVISGEVELGSGSGELNESISVSALARGEYEIRVFVSFQTTQGVEISRSKAFAVISDNSKLWFGVSSIGNAVKAKVINEAEQGNSLDLQKAPGLGLDALIEAAMQTRVKKSRENQAKKKQVSNNVTPITNAAAIKLGDPLSFEAKWVGPNTAGVDTNFPVNGAKITIKDKATHDHDANPSTPEVPLTADIGGYIVNGKFDFTAPRKDYLYEISVETDFPGIKADGSVEIAGGGIGSFKVKANTLTGSVYKVSPPDNSTSYVFSTTNLGGLPEQSGVWAAFHGMIEMVLQAKSQLKIDKDKNFSVVFAPPSGTSFYSSSSKSITILLADRFDWDVVAHEFGHAIADETNSVGSHFGNACNSSPPQNQDCSSHNGSNQYDYAPNIRTFQNKRASLNLAFNEGFGTWFGVTLLEKSSFKGRFQNVGDKIYQDTIDSSANTNLELNTKPRAFGEDTEEGIHNLLWDLSDSVGDSNLRAICATCKDTTNIGLKGVWDVINGSGLENISDFWEFLLEKNFKGKMSDFLKTGDKAIAGKDAALEKALGAGNTFAEFGIAPHLSAPATNTQIILIDKKGPKFKWSQQKTGTLKLDKFTLLLYTSDRKTLVFRKELPAGVTEYELVESDMVAIKTEVDGLSEAPNALIAVIMGEDKAITPDTGQYFGTSIDLLLQPFNRAVVLAVDSSGSNRSTDPSNLRISAARQTINNLRSAAEGKTQNKAPDLAGVIDFDSSVVVLSSLDDPDTVVGSVSRIDSSGGTNIAAGINAAVSLLTSTSAPASGKLARDRASIIVFTDGENGAGPIPVISAIIAASIKGIRVHMGFLAPFSSPLVNYEVAGDGPIVQASLSDTMALTANGSPTTIEEAILQSGGVYATINDAESQVAFVKQLENKGLTNVDSTDDGGQSVVGKTTTTDSLSDPTLSRSFIFNGQKDEVARLIVKTNGNFIPVLTIYDEQGQIVLVVRDDDRDGEIDSSVTLPRRGKYVAEVASDDGNSGIFTFFAGVNNIANSLPAAANDLVSTTKNIAVTTADVTLNDTDADNDVLVVTLADPLSAQNGVVVYNNDNTFTYTPPTDYIGTDSFNYTVSDGNGGSASATVQVTISASSTISSPQNIPVFGPFGLLAMLGGLFWFGRRRKNAKLVP